jgi:hypothetical protein
LLVSNVNGDLFLYFTRGGLRRGLSLFQAAGNRLPEIRIVARCNISTRFVSSA